MAGMWYPRRKKWWYLSKHFLSKANISLSIHKNVKITRTVPLLKSNSTYFYSILKFLQPGVGREGVVGVWGVGGCGGREMFF